MNPTERASHPSRSQLEALLDFLERNPSLAKGFCKVPSARDAARKTWEKLALQLNSLGGCVKSWKQWTKYWADKKSAVKKKGALRFQTRNKTGGGAAVVELNEIEERILTLMGGESFACGDRHLQLLNPFEDATDTDSPSILANQLIIGLSPTTDQQATYNEETVFTEVPETYYVTREAPQQASQYIECIPGTSHPSARPSVVHIMTHSPQPIAQSPPRTPPRIGPPASPVLALTPSGSGRHPHQHLSPRQRQTPPNNNRTGTSTTNRPRQRRRRAISPPSQRRSHLASITERFLRVEEQRISIERRNSEAFERLVELEAERDRISHERDTRNNQAMLAIAESLKMLAEALKNK